MDEFEQQALNYIYMVFNDVLLPTDSIFSYRVNLSTNRPCGIFQFTHPHLFPLFIFFPHLNRLPLCFLQQTRFSLQRFLFLVRQPLLVACLRDTLSSVRFVFRFAAACFRFRLLPRQFSSAFLAQPLFVTLPFPV